MVYRRALLSVIGWSSIATASGCLETMSGGRISGGADATELSGQRGEVVDVYVDAVTERNDGIRARDDGILAFNEESYDEAIGLCEKALDHFEAAEQGFGDASSLAYEIGEDEVGSMCEAAEEDAGLQIAATEAASNAAKAANGDGTSADVNGHVEEYRNLVEQAEEVPVEEPQTLADAIQSG